MIKKCCRLIGKNFESYGERGFFIMTDELPAYLEDAKEGEIYKIKIEDRTYGIGGSFEKIWDDWTEHYRKNNIKAEKICKDGIIDEVEYAKTKPKILFVMKETNQFSQENKEFDGDLRKLLRERPWPNIAKWAAGILNVFPEYSTINRQEVVKNTIRKIAVINLKKTTGRAEADERIINAYAMYDKWMLRVQIDRIYPDIIIACGAWVPDILYWVLDCSPINPDNSDDIRKYNGIPIIPCRHPTRASGGTVYKELKNKVKGLKIV